MGWGLREGPVETVLRREVGIGPDVGLECVHKFCCPGDTLNWCGGCGWGGWSWGAVCLGWDRGAAARGALHRMGETFLGPV